MSKSTTICAGIDTGKRKLDVALMESEARLQVDNTAEGHRSLSAWLRRHRVKRRTVKSVYSGHETRNDEDLRHTRFEKRGVDGEH